MGFILMLIIALVILIIYVFINAKIGNLKYRAKQQILQNTGISSAEIKAGITDSVEKKYLEKFLEEHTSFTEESIKELLKQYTAQIFNRNQINTFSQAVYEKMQNDSKIDKMQNMEFKRTNIEYYGNSKLNAVVVYTDNKDEYEVHLTCNITEEKIQLDKYQISKGAVIGF